MSDGATRPDFGRDQHAGTLTDLGCPACPGVLEVSPDGRKGYLTFVCRIGHAFSAQSLVDAKESALEDMLWSAVAQLDELLGVYEDFVERSANMQRPELARAYAERLAQGRAILAQLRALTVENRPPVERPGP